MAIIVIVLALFAGGLSIRYLGNDNAIEEVAEEVIKKESGLNIDLSPCSPES